MRLNHVWVPVICLASAIAFAQETAGAQQSVQVATAPSLITLPDATPVLLRTKQTFSSASAKVGDRVPFRVTEDVKTGDLIAIPRGAEAWGIVTAVKPRARKGRAGSLDIDIQYVQLLTGEHATLRAQEHSKGVGKQADMGLNMGELGATVVGLPLVPLLMLEKGGDAKLLANTKITAYLNGNVQVDLAALEHAQRRYITKGPRRSPFFVDRVIGSMCLQSFVAMLN